MGGEDPHLLAPPEQRHKAERGILMTGEEEGKSFTAFSNALRDYLTDWIAVCPYVSQAECTHFVKATVYMYPNSVLCK